MKTIKWFATAFGIAFGSTAGILASAAPGDLIIKHQTSTVQITAEQAAQAANWAIGVGAWDKGSGDLRFLEVYKSESGFFARAKGVTTAAPADLPVSNGAVEVVGIVQEE